MCNNIIKSHMLYGFVAEITEQQQSLERLTIKSTPGECVH